MALVSIQRARISCPAWFTLAVERIGWHSVIDVGVSACPVDTGLRTAFVNVSPAFVIAIPVNARTDVRVDRVGAGGPMFARIGSAFVDVVCTIFTVVARDALASIPWICRRRNLSADPMVLTGTTAAFSTIYLAVPTFVA